MSCDFALNLVPDVVYSSLLTSALILTEPSFSPHLQNDTLTSTMAPERIIIDTDPGIDDILAMLLAFSCTPEEVEVVLVSVTFGNVQVHE